MSPPVVVLDRVRKSFHVNGTSLEAISDFSLSICEGEFVSIVGCSGCGKSTLLRLLAGLDGAYEGDLLVDGHRFAGVGGERGIVFQELRLFPWLTVERNIALGIVNEKLKRNDRDARIAEYISLVGLSGFERALPHQLSGGMAQRVAIARGLIANPRILMLDEPFGSLDALTRHQMQVELLRIREHKSVTTVLVTHDVAEALYLSDRVVVMTPRPGTVRSIVDVNLPRPRQRTSGAYQDLHGEILNQLTLPYAG